MLVTSYEMMRVHASVLLSQRWQYIVLDEGHKIRNPDAEVTLVAKRFNTGHRLILTGAPIQNKLAELWSLFDFVYPGKLGTLPMFEEQFALPISQGAYANASDFKVQAAYQCSLVLRDLIRPHLLRRTKADVQLNLPNKSEQVLFCQLTDEQREVYERFLQTDLVSKVLQGRANAFAALSSILKVCNHPHLLTWLKDDDAERDAAAAAAEAAEADRPEGVDAKVAAAALGCTRASADVHYGDWRLSGKMVVLRQILRMWSQRGDRALLFCQTKQMLDIVQGHVAREGFSYRRLDGSTPVGQRLVLIDEYNSDDEIFLFLLTTRAGGLGINLTGANRVLLIDPDWNPANDLQARERAYRLGQTRQVSIYRLVTSGTLEEKVYQRQIFKTFLSSNVIGGDPKQARRVFKPRDLKDLLAPPDSAERQVEGTETGDLFAHAERTAADTFVEGAPALAPPPAALPLALPAPPPAAAAAPPSSNPYHAARGGESLPPSRAGSRPASQLGSQLGSRPPSACDGAAAASSSAGFLAMVSREPANSSSSGAGAGPTAASAAAAAAAAAPAPASATDATESTSSKNETSLLAELLNGDFVSSALDHDAVLGSSKAKAGSGMAAVEARKVAERAATALRDSFAQRQRERVNLPTWTGRSGGAGLPGQRRFGGALNPLLARGGGAAGGGGGGAAGKAAASFFSQSQDAAAGGAIGSAALLGRIRERQEAGSAEANTPDAAAAKLVRKLDDFFGARHGRCTSEQLVKEFASKDVDRNLLKALLKQLAHKDEMGNWVLNPQEGREG